MEWFWLVVALGVILGGAELFTNGVEWVGAGFGLSEGAVGSVLAAVGTALPETVLPFIAIALGHDTGREIGVGAILGAPLMLTTLAMFVLGVTVLVFSRLGGRGREIRADPRVPRLDLGVFLGLFALAVGAGLWHWKPFHWALAGVLVLAYGLYVGAHFRSPVDKAVAREAVGEIKPLYLRRMLRRSPGPPSRPPPWASVVQTLIGLAVIVGGARLFVTVVTDLAERFHVRPLPFALLVAPVATELPEIFNASVIWARRGKDTLAVGNITGAMVFQAVFPVAIGLLFTPWRLSHESLVAAVVALGAGGMLYSSLALRGRFGPKLLLLQGAIYVGFIGYLVARSA
jgi:cation:H+ antiporter